MISWWENLTSRERLMVIFGLTCALLYLFYYLLLAPINHSIKRQTVQLAEKKNTLLWLQRQQKQYAASHKKLQKINNSALLTLITNQLKEPSLQSFIYQLQQTGTDTIQLTFETVPYGEFLTWLWTLDNQYTITIKQLNVEQSKIPGIVKLTLNLSS